MALHIFFNHTKNSVNQKDTLSCQNIPNNHGIFCVSHSDHLPLLFVVNPMKEAPKGTKIPQFWHLTFPVDSQPCNQFSFSGYESNFFFFFFLSLFPYLHNGDKTPPSPMDNYQIKSPVYEMLQSETSRTIVEPWEATILLRQQHLWTKKPYHCFKGTNQTFSIPVFLGRLIHNI